LDMPNQRPRGESDIGLDIVFSPSVNSASIAVKQHAYVAEKVLTSVKQIHLLTSHKCMS
jgi:hypothetical protein